MKKTKRISVPEDQTEILVKEQEKQQVKMLKRNICLFALTVCLACPIYSEPYTDAVEPIHENSLETVSGNDLSTEVLPEQIPDSLVETQYKHPTSKKEIIKKFILAMFGVLISSLIIYFGLSMYNKLRYNASSGNTSDQETGERDSLEVPNNMSDAVKGFIGRTKWE